MAEPNPAHALRIIPDDAGHSVAKRVFETYIKGEDGSYARYAEFLIAFDRLLDEFGGRRPPPEPEDGEDQGEGDESAESEGPDDGEPYADDEDVHEASEVDHVRAAVARVLRR